MRKRLTQEKQLGNKDMKTTQGAQPMGHTAWRDGTGAHGDAVFPGANGGICIKTSALRSSDSKASLPETYPREIISESPRMFITASFLVEKGGEEGRREEVKQP